MVKKMNNTTYICYVRDQNITKIDEFRCGLINLAATLYLNNFEFICMFITVLIMLISIFGKIKGNYQWFIFHQAFWDFATTYDNLCNAGGIAAFLRLKQPKCFYVFDSQSPYSPLSAFSTTILIYISTASFAALLLLPASRFLALYYFKLYEKLKQKWRIIFVIFIFNFILIIFHIGFGYSLFAATTRPVKLTEICSTPKLNITCLSQMKEDPELKLNIMFFQIFTISIFWLPLLYLFFTILFAILIVVKILKQAKFQQKHKKKDFYNTLRIAAVIILQTSINAFALFIESLVKFQSAGIPLILSTTKFPLTKYDIDFRLPLWLDGSYGLTSNIPRHMVSQIRVFLDSFVVLVLMTGYREAIIDLLKIIYSALKNPQKAFYASKSYFRKRTSVTNQWM